jgi:hypothetical protein
MNNPFKSSKNKRFEKEKEPEKAITLATEKIQEKQPDNIRSVYHNADYSRPQREVRHYDSRPSSSFKSFSKDPPKKIYYEHKNEEFPELVKISNSDNDNKCALDYKNASLKEDEENTENVIVYEPGWLYMKIDKSNNNILKKLVPSKINRPNISPQQQLNNLMNNAIKNMEENHNKFIENYGEDNYQRDYHIQSYYEMAEEYEEYDESSYECYYLSD